LFRRSNQPCLYWILLNVRFRLPELFRVPDPPIVEAAMLDWEGLRPLDSDPVGRTAFDHLHRFFNRCLVTWREQYMQMLRHQRERVQFVESKIAARNNLLHNSACQDVVDEKGVSFPSICRHKVDTGLPNATRDFRHSRTARG
jgi:hypothetical protein